MYFYSFQLTSKDNDDNDFEYTYYINNDQNDKCEMFLTYNGLYSWRYLKYIILSDRPFIESKISLLPRSEIFVFVISDLQIECKNPFLFEHVSTKHLYKILLNLISNYFTYQTLYLANTITTLLIQYLSYHAQNNLKSIANAEILRTFSIQKIQEVFGRIEQITEASSNHQKLEINEIPDIFLTEKIEGFLSNVLKTKEFQEKDIDYYGQLEIYLSRVPNFDIHPKFLQSFYDSLYEYPALATSIIDYILNTIQNGNIALCSIICGHILKEKERIQDFSSYIFIKSKFFTLIQQFIHMITITDNEEQFYQIWILTMTMIRLTFGSGTVGFYDRLNFYIENLEIVPIRFFIRVLVHNDPEKEDITTLNEFDYCIDFDTTEKFENNITKYYPYYVSSRILNDLLKQRITIIKAIEIAHDHPYLWPSIFIYINYSQKKEDILLLTKQKYPKNELNNLLFKQIMIRIMDNKQKRWISASETFDLLIMRENPPICTNDLSIIISNSLKYFVVNDYLKLSIILGVCNTWYALSDHFGVDVFTNILLHEILITMNRIISFNDNFDTFNFVDSVNDYESPLSLFTNSIGHVLGVFNNYETYRLKSLVIVMTKIVDNEIELLKRAPVAFSFVQFGLILMNDAKDCWEEPFRIIIERCKKNLLIFCSGTENNKVILAQYFIRISLTIPKLRDIVINDPVISQLMISLNDCPAIIDFFIAKDISFNSQNKVV